MRALPRILALSAACLALATPAGATGRGDPPTSRDLQRRADSAAARYEKAQADLARTSDEVARLERRIGAAEARLAPLRAAVTRRAVAVYTTDLGMNAFAGFLEGVDWVEAGRGAKLASGISAREFADIRATSDVARDLAGRRDDLAARRADQQQLADDLQTERRNVELALSFMARREQEQTEQALQSRLLIPRASRSSGPIPVVTDFVCPIRGPLSFVDSWGAPRPGGRAHEGTDLMNTAGTPNVAVVPGDFVAHISTLGGLSIYLHGDDGNTYYYAHLSQIVGPDRRVAQGEVIGLTGSTGDATTPHTHFEFHPGGGPAIDSYPLVRDHC
ncbi:MAG TPA: M23 family metallopeptidase [Acidimicrobiia bacterium]